LESVQNLRRTHENGVQNLLVTCAIFSILWCRILTTLILSDLLYVEWDVKLHLISLSLTCDGFVWFRIQNMKIIDGKPEYKGALVSVTCIHFCRFDGLRLCICQVICFTVNNIWSDLKLRHWVGMSRVSI